MNRTDPGPPAWPAGRPPALAEGVFAEPSAEGRIILWARGGRDGRVRHWERIASVARAAVASAGGVGSIAATSARARQRLDGPLGRLSRVLVGGREDGMWAIPGGGWAEPCGARRADLRLAWAEAGAPALDAGRIRALWPGIDGCRPLGEDLFLVGGIAPALPPGGDEGAGVGEPPGESPRALAGRALAAARGARDPGLVASALADLGAIHLREGDPRRAAELLGEALAAARRAGDAAREEDATLGLAQALLRLGRSGPALGLLGPALDRARIARRPYAEKLALDRMAWAHVGLGDHAAALACLEAARAIAAAVGDRRHEAGLLWRVAVERAELGRRAGAVAAAGAAVDRLRALGDPAAAWYAHHLASYRVGAGEARPDLGGSIDVHAGSMTPDPAIAPTAVGPGPLRMALSAARSMAAFLGSGLKMASPEAYRARLAACAACEHHAGVRCRICGCITAAKARPRHERCPAGNW